MDCEGNIPLDSSKSSVESMPNEPPIKNEDMGAEANVVEDMNLNDGEKKEPGCNCASIPPSPLTALASADLKAMSFEERDAIVMAFCKYMKDPCKNHPVPKIPRPRYGTVREENRDAYEFCLNQCNTYSLELDELQVKAREPGMVRDDAFFKKVVQVEKYLLGYRATSLCFID